MLPFISLHVFIGVCFLSSFPSFLRLSDTCAAPTAPQTPIVNGSDRQEDGRRHGGHLALPVPADRHRGLHGREVVSDPQVHRGSLRSGLRSHGRRGLLLPPGGDRARKEDQAADLGHGGSRAIQVGQEAEKKKKKP